jgi:hypothetical protein
MYSDHYNSYVKIQSLHLVAKIRNKHVRDMPAPSFGQVAVESRLIPGSTVAKLPVVLACH